MSILSKQYPIHNFVHLFSGFDEDGGDEFISMQAETEKLEQYIKEHYSNGVLL